MVRVTLSAADSFDNAVLRPPLWASTDGTVAIVDELGDVHAVGFGTATVHATLDGLSDTARVIVAPHEGAHATLAYIRPDGPYVSRIIALDTMQDRRHTVYEKIGDQPFLLDWSPDGTRLVFTGTSPAPHISVIDVPTRRVIRLGGIPQDPLGGKLAWSPLGDRIAYLVRSATPNVELRVVAPDGSGLLRLPANGVDMSWSPEGDLVYLRQESGSALPELWRLRRQERQPDRIAVDTSLIADADAVRVSPDGTRIMLFDGRGPLLVLDRSGALLHAIDVTEVVDAQWLPDGRIVFAQRSYAPLEHHIFRVGADGSDLAPVTDETFAFISDLDVNADGGLLFRSFGDLIVVAPDGTSTILEQEQVLSPTWGH